MKAKVNPSRRRILEIYNYRGNSPRELIRLNNATANGVSYFGLKSRKQEKTVLPKGAFLLNMRPSALPFTSHCLNEVHLSFIGREKTSEKIIAEVREAARVLKPNGLLIISGEENARTQDGQDVSNVAISALSGLRFVVNGPIPKESLILTPLLEEIQKEVGEGGENGRFLILSQAPLFHQIITPPSVSQPVGGTNVLGDYYRYFRNFIMCAQLLANLHSKNKPEENEAIERLKEIVTNFETYQQYLEGYFKKGVEAWNLSHPKQTFDFKTLAKMLGETKNVQELEEIGLEIKSLIDRKKKDIYLIVYAFLDFAVRANYLIYGDNKIFDKDLVEKLKTDLQFLKGRR